MAEAAADSSSEDGDSDLRIASHDFSKLEDKHTKTGFREGTIAGKEATLQRGFSDGFSSGVEYAVHWGGLKGKISALQAYCTLRGIPAGDLISELLKEVEKQEEDERKAAFTELQHHYRDSVHQMEGPPKLPSSHQPGTVDRLSGSSQQSTVDRLPGTSRQGTVDSLPGTSRQGTVDSLLGSSPPPAAVASLEQQLQTLIARFRQR